MANTLTITKKKSFIRTLETYTRSNKTLSSYLNQFRPTTWNKKELLTIKLTALNQSEFDSYITFLEQNQGLTINLVRIDNQGISGQPCSDDNENTTTWSGIINSNAKISRKHRCASWDLEFSFIGTKQ